MALNALEQEFVSNIPHLSNRDIIVSTGADDRDLISYSEISQKNRMQKHFLRSLAPPKPALPLPEEVVEEESYTLENLAMQLTSPQIFVPSICVAKVEELLKLTVTIIRKTAEEIEKRGKPGMKKVFVVGNTGAGRSTLLGYLIGHEMKKEYYRIDYASVAEPGVVDRPVIGHRRRAQTKGCSVYHSLQAYLQLIDSAGSLDSGGAHSDLINAVSLTMMSETHPPDVLLVMITSSAVLEARSSGFLTIIHNLMKAFRAHELETVLPALVFVINDPSPTSSFDSTKMHLIHWAIGDIIKDKEEDSNDIRNSVGVTAGRMRMSASNVRRFNELETELRILRHFREHPGQIIAMDVSEDSIFRSSLASVIREATPLPVGSFRPEYLYETAGLTDISEEFTNFVCGCTTYFNKLFGRLKILKNISSTTYATLLEREIALQMLSSGNQTKEDSLVNAENLIVLKKGEIKDMQDKIEANNKTISTLKTNKKGELMRKVVCAEAIEPRGFFSMPLFAKRYQFTYQTCNLDGSRAPIPVLICVSDNGAAGMKGGHFYNENIDYAAGKVDAWFLPGYYGFNSDKNAHIRVYVECRHHPETVQTIKELLKQNEEHTSLVQKFERELQGLVHEKASIEEDFRAVMAVQQEATQREVSDLRSRNGTYAIDMGKVIRELESYRDLMCSFHSAIEALNLYDKVVTVKRTRLSQFTKYLQEFDLVNPVCFEDPAHKMWLCSRVFGADVQHIHCTACQVAHAVGVNHELPRWSCLPCNINVCLSAIPSSF